MRLKMVKSESLAIGFFSFLGFKTSPVVGHLDSEIIGAAQSTEVTVAVVANPANIIGSVHQGVVAQFCPAPQASPNCIAWSKGTQTFVSSASLLCAVPAKVFLLRLDDLAPGGCSGLLFFLKRHSSYSLLQWSVRRQRCLAGCLRCSGVRRPRRCRCRWHPRRYARQSIPARPQRAASGRRACRRRRRRNRPPGYGSSFLVLWSSLSPLVVRGAVPQDSAHHLLRV